MKEYIARAYDLRRDIVNIIIAGKGGHIGGDMSVLDIIHMLYFDEMRISPEEWLSDDRDRFVLSKGHSVEAYYAVLAARGFLELDEVIRNFSCFGSQYIGHPNNKLPGIEMNSGSLGHGLSVCVGMALAGKMNKKTYRVYTVMGDGELAEGSVWEGVMAARQYQLSNLCAIVDRNRLQISGGTEEVMGHDDLAERFLSFGWNVIVLNGHDYRELRAGFRAARAEGGKPTVIIANTIKGYGSAVMENKAAWHHRVPSEEEKRQIFEDFAKRKEAALHE